MWKWLALISGFSVITLTSVAAYVVFKAAQEPAPQTQSQAFGVPGASAEPSRIAAPSTPTPGITESDTFGYAKFPAGAEFGEQDLLVIDKNGGLNTDGTVTVGDLHIGGTAFVDSLNLSDNLYVAGNKIIDSTGRIPGLSIDYLASLDGSALSNVNANSLNGFSSSAFLKTDTAVDADKVDGIDSGSFLRSDTSDTAGGAITFTATPGGTGVGSGPLYVNPASSTANYTLLGAAVNGTSKFKVDAEGDVTITGDLTVQGNFSGGSTVGGFTSGSVLFADSAGDLDENNSKFFWDDTNYRLGINTTSPGSSLDVRGSAVFNEAAGDYDFRVEGTSDPNLLSIDASQNKVGVGIAIPAAKFQVNGAAVGQALAILNETGDQDLLAASASGTPRFRITNAGSMILGTTSAPFHAINSDGSVVFNEQGNNASFRVESDTDPNALAVTGSNGYVNVGQYLGVGGTNTSYKLYVAGQGRFNDVLSASADVPQYGSLIYANGSIKSTTTGYASSMSGLAIYGDSISYGGATDGSASTGVRGSTVVQGAANVTWTSGLSTYIDFRGTSTTSNAASLLIPDANSVAAGATLSNLYGVYIASQTKGASNNYALYTNLGKVYFGDNVGIGTTSPATNMKLDVNGRMQLNLGGTQTSTALCGSHSAASGATVSDVEIVDCTGTPGADYMEMYPVETSASLGDIVAVGTKDIYTKDGERIKQLVRTTQAYQTNTIGIVSDHSKAGDFNSIGYNINNQDNPQPIALAGRVPVKMAANSAAVQAGDYLTISSQPGKAMKATHAGPVIGKALEDWQPGQSTVMVFVHNSYYLGEIAENGNLLEVPSSDAASSSALTSRDQLIQYIVEDQVDQNQTAELNFALRFLKDVWVNGVAKFTNAVEFLAQVTFRGKTSFEQPPEYQSTDVAGFAKIAVGAQEVKVRFAKTYVFSPVIQVTPLGNYNVHYWVSDSTVDGFTLHINQALAEDAQFTWSAVAVKDVKTFESEGQAKSSEAVAEPEKIETSTPSPSPTPVADLGETEATTSASVSAQLVE